VIVYRLLSETRGTYHDVKITTNTTKKGDISGKKYVLCPKEPFLSTNG
jgi:hypothetical protein